MHNHVFPAMNELGKRISAAPQLLLCLDFDGTLAPLEDDPSAVFLPPATKQVLETLAGYKGLTLAFMGGRSLADLQDRISITGGVYIGNHGLEISGPGFRFVEPGAQEAAAHLQGLGTQLKQALSPIAGVMVEDKGLSISVHYRQAADVDGEAIWSAVQAVVAAAQEYVHLIKGNKVYEIRPHLRWHMGMAIDWIQRRLGQPGSLVIYLGDDITDEDAFSTLAHGITIRVGDTPGLTAQYTLQDPTEVGSFLGWIEVLMRGRGHGR